jgi:hypothetical protein
MKNDENGTSKNSQEGFEAHNLSCRHAVDVSANKFRWMPLLRHTQT